MNILTRKLMNFVSLSEADRALLDQTTRAVREYGPGQQVIAEGDAPDHVHLVLDGFACRYKVSDGGERSIMAYLVPGDFCDLHVFILKEMDHTIATLSPCRIAEISRSLVLQLTERPTIARGLWWATLVDEAVLREWLVNIGRRDAVERLAHLLCELLLRLEAVGMTFGESFELPITQVELADTLGLSAVHLNRSMQALRAKNLITLNNKKLVVLDFDGLKALGSFNPNYLHLAEDGRSRLAQAS